MSTTPAPAQTWEDTAALALTRASPSSLKLLAQCPRAYAFRYIEKAPGGKTPAMMAAGTLAHLALERAARQVMGGGNHEFPPETLASFIGPDDGTKFPAQAVADARATLRSYAPIFDARHAVNLEERFEMTLGDVRVRGIIDRIDARSDYKDIRVIDYKSGYPVMDRDGYESDPQTLIYGLAAREYYPFAERVTVEYHFLAAGFRFAFLQGEEEAEQGRDLVSRSAEAYARSAAAKSWGAEVSSACVRCDYRARCKTYGEALEEKRVGELEGSTWTTEALILARQRCKALADIAEARRKELDALLQPRIAEMGMAGKIKIPGLVARIATRDNVHYPEVRSVGQVLGYHAGIDELSALEGVVEVKKTAVARFVEERIAEEGRARAEADIEALAVHAGSAWVEVRKSAKGDK